jgi:hypothetical protein
MNRFVGALLMAMGVLIGGLSGACTLIFLAMSFSPGGGGMVPLTLIIGLPPILIGVGLFVGGRVIWRKAAPPPSPAAEAPKPD